MREENSPFHTPISAPTDLFGSRPSKKSRLSRPARARLRNSRNTLPLSALELGWRCGPTGSTRLGRAFLLAQTGWLGKEAAVTEGRVASPSAAAAHRCAATIAWQTDKFWRPRVAVARLSIRRLGSPCRPSGYMASCRTVFGTRRLRLFTTPAQFPMDGKGEGAGIGRRNWPIVVRFISTSR